MLYSTINALLVSLIAAIQASFSNFFSAKKVVFNFKNKRSFKGVLPVFLCLIVLVACNKNEPMPTKLSNAYSKDELAVMKTILTNQYGFLDSTIVETDSNFVVQGDMVFDKMDFVKNYQLQTANTAAKHYRLQYLVSLPQTIPLSISPNVPARWQQAVYDAVAKWNSLNLKLKLSAYVSNTCPANGVTIEWRSLGTALGVVAQSNLPTSDGKAGKVMTINSTSIAITNSDYRRNIIAHEIGHCCASLHHTDFVSAFPLNLSTTCNGKDPNSLMQSSPSTNTYTFTSCDLEAIRYLIK
jgi:hypothetical protein